MFLKGSSYSVRAAAALVLTAAAVASCTVGSSSTSPGSAGSQSTLDKVVASGALRVGAVTGNAPFESIDPSGNLIGYDIDVVTLLAKELGVKAVVIKTTVPGRVSLLQTGRADVTVGSFTRTHKRSEAIAFSDPINVEFVQLLAGANRSDLNMLSDFNRSEVKIAVATGSTQASAVATALPKATPVAVPGVADELQAVMAGQADAAAVANTQIDTLAKQNPGKFKTIHGALSAYQEDGLGLPRDDFAWWLYVNQFIHDINADGTNYRLYQRWFGPTSSPGPFAQAPSSGSSLG